MGRPFKHTGQAATLRLKDRVRRRDGNRCTQCGMTQADHLARYRSRLEVHRIVPGSEYSEQGCVTLCIPCHGPMPRRPRGTYPSGFRLVRLTHDLAHSIRIVAAYKRMSVAKYVSEALRSVLARDLALVAKKNAERADELAEKKKNGHKAE